MCEWIYAGDNMDEPDDYDLCQSLLHVEGQSRYVGGDCCRGRPSVYLEGLYAEQTGT